MARFGGGRWDAAEVSIFEPIAVPFQSDDVGVVDEAVDHGAYGDIGGIEASSALPPRRGSQENEVEKELGYFLNNAPHAVPVVPFPRPVTDSGVVEANCKSVIGQRLKQSGVHWTVRGADAIIALHCEEASSQWEAICNNSDTQTRTTRSGGQPSYRPVTKKLADT